MPGNCFAFSVLVCREDQFVCILEKLLQLLDLLLLIRIDDVEGCELIFDIDTFTRPGEFLVLLWNVRCPLW